MVDVSKTDNDRYYLIYVNNTFGEIKIYDYSTNRKSKRQESKSTEFVFSVVDDIHNLIIENKDTYKDQEKFKELEHNTQLKKRNGEGIYTGDSSFIYPISSIDHTVVFNAYLSKSVMKKVKKYANVLNIEPNLRTAKFQSYYNTKDILEETHWNNVTVREDADFHLSLISQGTYEKNLVNKYDNNYYYPSSAGEGIDIIIIDTGFHFNYNEFSNTDERTVMCVGSVFDDNFNPTDECTCSFSTHGDKVADVAGGLKHGVASKANIYGIAHSTRYIDISDGDAIAALQQVYDNMIRENKTVISISYAIVRRSNDSFYNHYTALLDKVAKKGAIIVGSSESSNVHIDSEDDGYYFLPCSSKSVICVGGIENESKSDMTTVYTRSKHSSYGRDVDIYAPFWVNTEIVKNGKVVGEEGRGCSFATPIVSGIVATIMSDHEHIAFNKTSMLEFLLNNAIPFTDKKNGISYMVNNGKHIVYSEDGIYNGCGVNAGNQPCSQGSSTKMNIKTTTKSTTKPKTTTTTSSKKTTKSKITSSPQKTLSKKTTTSSKVGNKKKTTTSSKIVNKKKTTSSKIVNKKETTSSKINNKKTTSRKIKINNNKKTTYKVSSNKKITNKTNTKNAKKS
ncbi:hypothetical protein PIROE2DRAFT_6774 [Piromyces sp. E2]|nr:hypothetical protein PIROE2DRAFT_6774 [Piromyces sp. E2]|eukprot:OUM66066.1 hypothetical protein PIROE2DRAFT_6774 [Piromyces sp. E2]